MPLYVEETGTPGAPSVVFMHGVGASGWMWWQQMAAFRDFHCLNVDLPGHGKSSHVPWVSLADTADQIAAIIQARATNGQAAVVGLSLGGYVAMVLLEHHTERVSRAVLSGVTAAPMPNRSLLKPQLWFMSVLKRRPVASLQAKALSLPPTAQAAFIENLQAMSIDTYRRIMEEAVVFQVSPGLRHVNVPTLVTAGGRETEIILQAVTVIADLMPNAVGRLAPGGRHGWNVEAPDLFNAMLRAWLTNTPLPAALEARGA